MITLLLSVLPLNNDIVRESVDLIELNHFYDEQARLVFDQVIFYEWDNDTYSVRAWRLVKHQSQIPVREPSGLYVATWQDSDRVRRVESLSYRETWTQYDPELHERDRLPKELRRELRTR